MNTDPQFIATMVKMIGLLIILVGGLWGFSWFAKKRLNVPGGKWGGKKIRVIENCHFGVKKTISLIQVPGKVLVVGISGENLTLLSELNEDAVDEEYTQSISVHPAESPFTNQLKRISKKMKKDL